MFQRLIQKQLRIWLLPHLLRRQHCHSPNVYSLFGRRCQLSGLFFSSLSHSRHMHNRWCWKHMRDLMLHDHWKWRYLRQPSILQRLQCRCIHQRQYHQLWQFFGSIDLAIKKHVKFRQRHWWNHYIWLDLLYLAGCDYHHLMPTDQDKEAKSLGFVSCTK